MKCPAAGRGWGGADPMHLRIELVPYNPVLVEAGSRKVVGNSVPGMGCDSL